MALIELNLEKPAFKRTELLESDHASGGRSSRARGRSESEEGDFEEIDLDESGGRSRASRMAMLVTVLMIAMIGIFAAKKFRGRSNE